MMMRNYLAGGLLLMVASGCLREELPVPVPEAAPQAGGGGPLVTAQVCVGSSYEDQVWYDLGTNMEVARNSKMAWDLAFEGHADGWQVRLNPARFMRAIGTAQTDISQPLDTTGFGPGWRIDHPEGSRDSTAIGDWRGEGRVYAIDMGYNVFGAPIGVRKLQVVAVDDAGYTVRVARLNGSNLEEVVVPKDPQRRFVHFLFSSASVVSIAPPDGQYDLVFTQYTTQFYDPYMAYIVTGAVNGFSGTRVAQLISTDFASVTLNDSIDHPFSSREDAVGYGWKEYNFTTSVYDIFPEHVFLIEDAQGRFHKVHFVDFYGPTGQRGCPMFEVVSY